MIVLKLELDNTTVMWQKVIEIYRKEIPLLKQKSKEYKGKIKNFASKWNKYIKGKIFFPIANIYFRTKNNKNLGAVILKMTIAIFSAIGIWYLVNNDFLWIEKIQPDSLSNYYLVIGSMIGAAIAVVFTLSLFALQKAAELFSTWFIEKHIHDWKEAATYTAIVAIDIWFFIMGLGIKSNQFLIENKVAITYSLLLATVLTFELIYWHFENTLEKTDPIRALNIMNKETKQIFQKAKRQSEEFYKILLLKNPLINKKIVILKFFEAHLSRIDLIIQNCFDISNRLLERHQIEASKRGILQIKNIITDFFKVGEKSFLLTPSDTYILATDSTNSHFLALVLERLVETGKNFIRDGKIDNARYIVDIFNDIGISASQINYEHNIQRDNPIFSLIRGYLVSEYIQFAMNTGEQEIIFKGLKSLPNLALAAIKANLSLELEQIQNDIFSIAKQNLHEKRSFIIDTCNNSYVTILNALLYNDFSYPYAIKSCLEKILDMLILTDRAMNAGLFDEFKNSNTLTQPFYDISNLIDGYYSYYLKLKDPSEQKKIESKLLTLIDEIYKILREFSREGRICGTIAAPSAAFLLNTISAVLIDIIRNSNFVKSEDFIKKTLSAYIHLPSMFIGYSKITKLSNSFFQLTDFIATTALKSYLRTKDVEMIDDGIKSLFSISKNLITGGFSEGYYESRKPMIEMIKLATIALKDAKKEVLEKAIKNIEEFQKLYDETYHQNAPKEYVEKENLESDTYKWRFEFQSNKWNRSTLFEDSDSILEKEITIEDIDRFIANVWETIPRRSSIEEELKRIVETRIKDRIEKQTLEKKIGTAEETEQKLAS